MTKDKKYQILKAIKTGAQFSKNNKDMAYLQANGYIDAKNVMDTSYLKAEISLTDYGEVFYELWRGTEGIFGESV